MLDLRISEGAVRVSVWGSDPVLPDVRDRPGDDPGGDIAGRATP
ncbi:hypothetical protein SGLAM104S_00024 [Streptomyces glaucescens]